MGTFKQRKRRTCVRLSVLAEWTGLEPATPGVTGRYSNQLNYHSETRCSIFPAFWWVLTGSNRRHPACKASALPTELSTHCVRPRHGGRSLPHPPPLGQSENRLRRKIPKWQQHAPCSREYQCVITVGVDTLSGVAATTAGGASTSADTGSGLRSKACSST